MVAAADRTEPLAHGCTVTLFRGDRAERLDDFADVPGRLGRSTLMWIDLESPTEEPVRRIADEVGIDEESVGSLLGRASGPAVRDGGTFVHLTVHAPDADAPDELAEVECVVGKNWVVTAHERTVRVLDEFAELASGSGSTGDLDGPTFLAALLEWVLHEYAMSFERLEQDLEEFDERAMRGRGRPEQDVDYLVDLRKQLGRLRRSLAGHRGPLLALAHPDFDALSNKSSAERFESLLERYELTFQSARDVRESIVGSFDVLLARTGHRTNETVKVLTLASVILLPGALLAGVMGMNFKVGLFEHDELFWVVLGVILMIGVVTLTVAKLRDWI